MAKAKDINDTEGVTAHIQKLEPAFAAMVETLRQIILNTDKEIGEQIKWNSPSFFYTGTMAPFDPKEYKRDIIVMNLRNGIILLVFPTGAVINDTTGLLEGDYKDGRRMVTFKSMDEIQARSKDLQKVIKLWMKMIDK